MRSKLLLHVLLFILFVNVIKGESGKFQILMAELGDEIENCKILLHVSVLISPDMNFDVISPSTVLTRGGKNLNIEGASYLIYFLDIQNQYSPSISQEVSIRIQFNLNGTISDLPLGLQYTCIPSQLLSINEFQPNLPLLPKATNSFFFQIPSMNKIIVSPTISLTSGYTGVVNQNPNDKTSFEVTITASNKIGYNVNVDFSITIDSVVVISNRVLTSTLKTYDQTIQFNTLIIRDSYYSAKRPYLPYLITLKGDSSSTWFQPTTTLGTLGIDKVIGNPKTESKILTTLFYNRPLIPADYTLSIYNGIDQFVLGKTKLFGQDPTSVSNLNLQSFILNINGHSPFYINVEFENQNVIEKTLSLSSQFEYTSLKIETPFGIVGGTLKNSQYSVPLVIPPYLVSKPLNIAVYNPNSVDMNIEINPTVFDDFNSIVNSISLTYISGPYYLLRANITSGISGFNCLYIDSRKILNSFDLVQGTLSNGIYETLVDFNYLLLVNKITIYDNTLNNHPFNYGFYNVRGYKLDNFKSILIPTSITKLEFKYYNLDVSATGKWNTLYFNHTGAVPYSRIIFYPIILVSEISIDDPDILVNPKYQYEWDLNLKMFKIDFYLPRGLYANNITYYIGDLSNTGLHSSDRLYKIMGPQALLSVYSQDANQMFPYVKQFNILVADTYTLNTPTETATLIWTLKIESLLHPLKYMILTITSDYDTIGKNITLTPNDSINKNATLGDYEVRYNVSGASISQNYIIGYALLEDESSRQSGYNRLFMPDAFFNFHNTSFYSIAVNTPASTDTTPPYLVDWSVGVGFFVPMQAKRDFEVSFVTQDLDSPLSTDHVPVVYLSPNFGQRVHACTTIMATYSSDNKTGTYTAMCNPDYGFGFPNGFSLSVYGIVDQRMNARGYTGQHLSLEGWTHFLSSSIITFDPVLEAIIFKGYGALVLRGRNFGTSSGLRIEIADENQLNWNPITTTFNYYTGLEMSFDYIRNTSFIIRVVNTTSSTTSNALLYTYVPDSGSSTSSSQGNGSGSSKEYSSDSSKESSSDSQGPPTTPKPSTKPLCPNNCGGTSRGTCLETGGCKCIGNYYGEDCTSEIIIIPTPSIDTNTPTTTIIVPESGGKSVKVISLISIIGYNELDKDGDIVKNQTFNEWIYTNIKDGVYLYQTKIDNTTNVNVTIQYFTQSTSIQFAGQTLTMNPSSIKYQISIDRYQFKSSLNQLQFIMSAALNTSNNDDKCSFNQFDNTIEDSEYLRLQIDNYSLYGRFIKVGLIDSRPRNIINSVVNIDGSTVDTQQQSTSTSTSSQYIGIVVPYYAQHAVIDPDFSVLIDTNTAKDKQGAVCSSSPKDKSKLSGAQIAGIVIGCVGFTAVVVTAVVYSLYKTKKAKQFHIDMGVKMNKK